MPSYPFLFKNPHSNPKKLFLIDSIGALVTAILIGVVLRMFNDAFGMPVKALNVLSCIAVGFFIYSISCYFLVGKNWRTYLKLIAIANLLYCCLSIAYVIYFYSSLTVLGLAYFVGEVIIVNGIAWVELKMVGYKS